VDETGQDTKGKFFLVSVVISEKEAKDNLEKALLKIEQESGKKLLKWKKTHPRLRTRYLKAVLGLKKLSGNIFYASYQNRKDYIYLTGSTIAKAILHKAKQNYQATIYVHGFNPAEQRKVVKELKRFCIKYRKVKGAQERASVLIRLADAIVGFVRDYQEDKKYAQELFKEFQQKNIIQSL
jgi:hypothetical protein